MQIEVFDSSLEEFIKFLPKQTIAKVLRTIDLLEIFGRRLGLPHSKKISKQLFELRIRGKLEVRILYAFYKNQAIILHSFIKKSSKIPQKEINTAVTKLKSLTDV